MEKLNIPLQENPIPQKIWGIVVFAAPLFGAALLSFMIFRAYLASDTLSGFAPEGTELTVRVIKTAKTSEVMEDRFHGVELFPNSPITVDELSLWSKRGFTVFMGDSEVLGIAVSGRIPENVKTEERALGFQVAERTGGTYIGILPPQSSRFSFRMPVSLFLPWLNGEIRSSSGTSAPMNISERSISILGLGRDHEHVGNALQGEILTKIDVSKDEAKSLFGLDVPLTFPGISALSKIMQEHGFSLTIGEQNHDISYALGVPEGNVSREDLESLVSELYDMNHLSLSGDTDVYTSVDEIIASNTLKPVTTSDPSATVTSISDSAGAVVRATETAHSLILTNSQASVDQTESATNSCMPRAEEWISPKTLISLLPVSLSTKGMTIAEKLLESSSIAFKKNKTRICW